MKSLSMPEYISLNIPFIFILLLAFSAIAISYYFYKKTVPEIKNPVRYILIVLRVSVLTILFILLFSPKLSLVFIKEVSPKSAVYIDNSASMANAEQTSSVINFVKLLKNKLKDDNIDWLLFSKKISQLKNDSINFSGLGTNFNAVIKNAEKNKYAKILIISDGNNTETANFNTPPMTIFTVGAGKISNGADIYIADVKYSPIARIGKKELFEVVVGNKNAVLNRKIKIKLFLGKKLLATKVLQDIPSGTEQSVNFDYIPAKEGLSRFTVVMDTLKNEENIKNNRRTFVQKVIRKNRNIGLFIGIPDYDSKFISLLLSDIKEFDVYKYIDKVKKGSATDAMLDSLDVIFLSNFPGPFTSKKTLNKLKSVINKKHPGVIIKQGRSTDFKRLNAFQILLPYTVFPKNSRLKEYSAVKEENPLLILFKNTFLDTKFWQKLPPVNIQYIPGQLKSSSEIILRGGSGSSRIPLIISYAKGRFRCIYMGGDGYWRWYFTLTQYPDLYTGYQKLLSNFVYWASNAAKLRQITMETDNAKHVFKLGEKIALQINLYDANFNPLSNGNIELQAKWNKQIFNIEVENGSSGIYTAEFYPPGDGKYIITAKGFSGETKIGETKLVLEVVPLEREFISISQNVKFLKSLAQESGGMYFDLSADPDSLTAALRGESIRKVAEKNYELWYKPLILLIILIIITLEWIIRRKYRLL